MAYYTALLFIAVYLNRSNSNSLLLTLLVGLSWFLPVNLIQNRDIWYSACVMSELLVMISALALNTPAKTAIVGITAMLSVSHIVCWKFRSAATYYIVENYLEDIEIISCILFSNPILYKIKEVVQCHQRKC